MLIAPREENRHSGERIKPAKSVVWLTPKVHRDDGQIDWSAIAAKRDWFSFTSNQSEWRGPGNGVQSIICRYQSFAATKCCDRDCVVGSLWLAPAKKIWPHLFRTAQLTGGFQQVASSPDIYIDWRITRSAVELARRVSHFRVNLLPCGHVKRQRHWMVWWSSCAEFFWFGFALI